MIPHSLLGIGADSDQCADVRTRNSLCCKDNKRSDMNMYRKSMGTGAPEQQQVKEREAEYASGEPYPSPILTPPCTPGSSEAEDLDSVVGGSDRAPSDDVPAAVIIEDVKRQLMDAVQGWLQSGQSKSAEEGGEVDDSVISSLTLSEDFSIDIASVVDQLFEPNSSSDSDLLAVASPLTPPPGGSDGAEHECDVRASGTSSTSIASTGKIIDSDVTEVKPSVDSSSGCGVASSLVDSASDATSAGVDRSLPASSAGISESLSLKVEPTSTAETTSSRWRAPGDDHWAWSDTNLPCGSWYRGGASNILSDDLAIPDFLVSAIMGRSFGGGDLLNPLGGSDLPPELRHDCSLTGKCRRPDSGRSGDSCESSPPCPIGLSSSEPLPDSEPVEDAASSMFSNHPFLSEVSTVPSDCVSSFYFDGNDFYPLDDDFVGGDKSFSPVMTMNGYASDGTTDLDYTKCVNPLAALGYEDSSSNQHSDHSYFQPSSSIAPMRTSTQSHRPQMIASSGRLSSQAKLHDTTPLLAKASTSAVSTTASSSLNSSSSSMLSYFNVAAEISTPGYDHGPLDSIVAENSYSMSSDASGPELDDEEEIDVVGGPVGSVSLVESCYDRYELGNENSVRAYQRTLAAQTVSSQRSLLKSKNASKSASRKRRRAKDSVHMDASYDDSFYTPYVASSDSLATTDQPILKATSSGRVVQPTNKINPLRETQPQAGYSGEPHVKRKKHHSVSVSKRHATSSRSNDLEDPAKRDSHNTLERERRDTLRQHFQALRVLMTELVDRPKSAKVTILTKAVDCINHEHRIANEHVTTKDRLKKRNAILLRKLADLKADITRRQRVTERHEYGFAQRQI